MLSHSIASLGIHHGDICSNGVWNPKSLLNLCGRVRNWNHKTDVDLVIVGLDGYDTFRQTVDDRRDTPRPPFADKPTVINAVLMLKKDEDVPSDAWSYVDITVRPHQTRLLADMIACPHVVKAKTEVGKIAPEGLGLVVQTGIDPLALGDELIPLIGPLREHLACEPFGRHVRYEIQRVMQGARESVPTHPTRKLANIIRQAHQDEMETQQLRSDRNEHRVRKCGSPTCPGHPSTSNESFGFDLGTGMPDGMPSDGGFLAMIASALGANGRGGRRGQRSPYGR